VATELPEVTVGVGTILDGDQMRDAEWAGAGFVVSPGMTAELVSAARRAGIPWLPGVATPSEAMHAAAEGFEILKLFPATVVGGVPLLRALQGPLPRLRFCPTGGIDGASFRDYLEQPNVLCVGGSWMAPSAAVAAGLWSEITRRAREVAP
jgi:2-dehydro-3-deoxyphosphogluconate aldolase/(4S)-4-hydroxy-2-oxoglutarate aldolase